MALVRGMLFCAAALSAEILLFALIYKVFGLGEGAIQPVSQVMRVLALVAGCVVCARACTARVELWTPVCGLAAMVLLHLVYLACTGVAAPPGVWLSDAVLGGACGGAVGVWYMIRKKKSIDN